MINDATKRLLILLAAVLLAAPAHALTTNAAQITGTSTNDNAPAGTVGEYIFANGNGGTATVTISIASPAVITWTGHNFSANSGTMPVYFTTTGSLPTGITANTTYWIIPSSITTNTFEIATSIANALAGTAVNTSGSQSGTQTGNGGLLIGFNVFTNIAAISLTAGDWQACGTVGYAPATGTASIAVGAQIGTTSGANQGYPNSGMSAYWPVSWTGNPSFGADVPTGCGRISIASTTTYYLIGVDDFSSGSSLAFGFVGARRVR